MSHETRDCPRDGCDETRHTQIGIDVHLVNDHGLTVEAEQ